MTAARTADVRSKLAVANRVKSRIARYENVQNVSNGLLLLEAKPPRCDAMSRQNAPDCAPSKTRDGGFGGFVAADHSRITKSSCCLFGAPRQANGESIAGGGKPGSTACWSTTTMSVENLKSRGRKDYSYFLTYRTRWSVLNSSPTEGINERTPGATMTNIRT